MQLLIDTSDNENIRLSLLENGETICEHTEEAKFRQSEKLLPMIKEFLSAAGVKKEDLEGIVVNEKGNGFSSLRLGVVVANALAYGLGIDVRNSQGQNLAMDGFGVVKPEYASEPNIGK
jgi:tRNA A37 threonylcarbamoyladenosine modification protein TsaB